MNGPFEQVPRRNVMISLKKSAILRQFARYSREAAG